MMIRSILPTGFLIALLLGLVYGSFGQSAVPDTNRFIAIDGANLFVRFVGTGEPLIVLHGGPGMSHDYLAPEFIELLARDYQLIFYDQRASGRSLGVEDTARLTMAQFVRDLEGLRQQLKLDRLNLLGHSFGGLLAMQYAIAYPRQVNTLLLIDTAPASWELNFPYFRKTIAERQSEADREELAAIQQKPDFGTNPDLMDRYLKLYFRSFFKNPSLSQRLTLGIDQPWITHFNVTNARIWNSLGHYDIHDQLHNIQAPTLVMHGDYSVLSMDGAKAIAKLISNSTLVVLKEVGHFPYIEDPKTFQKAVREFLGDHPLNKASR